MSETCDELLKTLSEMEADLARRQKAIEHLREAIRLIQGDSPVKVSSDVTIESPADTPKTVAQVVDDFIGTLQGGDGFLAKDAVTAVVAAGYEENDALRANVSAALSRRINKTIERIGRGSFAKLEESEEASAPEDNESM